MATSLRILLLGPPVCERGQTSLSIARRQVRALLYRVAAEPQPLSRSYLAFLFWDDVPEESARRNLSRLLAYLAHSLAEPAVLQVDRSHVQLNPAQVWVDTWQFDHYWEAWKLGHQLEDLQAAATLYRGSFLSGFALPRTCEFSRWAYQEGERWEQRYLTLLEVLIDESAAWGETQQAIDYARQYLELNELAERVHSRLITLYGEQGDRQAARHQYEVCRMALQRELGVRPAPETDAAYQAALLEPAPALTSAPHEQLGWAVWPALPVPFVGRDAALDELSDRLARARAGDGGVVLVSGDAGIGKTRLMQEFASRQYGRVRVVAGSASPESVEMPYQPVIEALRPVLRGADLLTHVHRSWLAEASRLFPELAQLIQEPQPQAPLEAGEARARLFEALSRIILALSEGGCTVLFCLDDLQWADVTTLDWLTYLASRLRGRRMLVVGSYRWDESERLGQLRQVLAHHSDCRELRLAGLDEEAIARLISVVDEGLMLDRSLVQRLHETSGGNPFFLLETLRALKESSGSADLRMGLGALPLPDSVRQVVRSRLERVHPSARQILEAGAVLGKSFEYDTIAMTAGRGEMETLDGLDTLVARHFLSEKTTGYEFCHAIVRDAVYTGLGVWRRSRLHRRAAEAVARLRPDDALSIAWHYEQANKPGKAAGYLLTAGHAAMAVFAEREARACFDRALVLLEHEATALQNLDNLNANRRARIAVLYERGSALRLLGDMEPYTADLEEVARLARALGDPRALAHLHWQEAYNHRWFCRYRAVREAAEKGIRLSQEHCDAFLEAVCQRELGMAAREMADYMTAEIALERARELFTALGESVFTVHTLGNLSTLHCRTGRPASGMRLACQALEVCEQKGLPYERRIRWEIWGWQRQRRMTSRRRGGCSKRAWR